MYGKVKEKRKLWKGKGYGSMEKKVNRRETIMKEEERKWRRRRRTGGNGGRGEGEGLGGKEGLSELEERRDGSREGGREGLGRDSWGFFNTLFTSCHAR